MTPERPMWKGLIPSLVMSEGVEPLRCTAYWEILGCWRTVSLEIKWDFYLHLFLPLASRAQFLHTHCHVLPQALSQITSWSFFSLQVAHFLHWFTSSFVHKLDSFHWTIVFSLESKPWPLSTPSNSSKNESFALGIDTFPGAKSSPYLQNGIHHGLLRHQPVSVYNFVFDI